MRIAIAVVAAIAATSVSFAVATAANHQPVAQTSVTDQALVRQLKTLNRTAKTLNSNVSTLNQSIGTGTYDGLRGELRDVLGYKSEIGTSKSINTLLEQICDGTNDGRTYLC